MASHTDVVTAGARGGRHHADRVPVASCRWSVQVFRRNRKFVRSFVLRLAVMVALLMAAAAGGVVGVLAAPLIGQPREAGFWGGGVVVFVLYVLALVVVVIGSALRVPSLMRWRDRLEWLA